MPRLAERVAETDRLYIDKLTVEDNEFMFKLVNSPNWIEGIGNRNIRTKAAARRYLMEGPISSYHQNGFGLYKLIRKDDSQVIGICGLVKRKELALPDLGFALLPQFEKMGYAHEASQEVINLARKKFQLHKILAITSKSNERSIALLEKLGFVYQKNKSEEMAGDMLLYAQPLQIF